MATCPTKQAFIEDLEDKFELSRDEKIKLSKMYDRLMALKDEVDEDLVLGDEAMTGYNGKDITDKVKEWLGSSEVVMRINGSIATMKRELVKAYDRRGSIVMTFTDGITRTFNKGQDRSHDLEGGGKVKYVEVDGLGKWSFELGSKAKTKTRNWDNLKKREDYEHGNVESMLKMLDELHELGGKKATDADMAYYRRLIEAMNPKFFTEMGLYMKNTSHESAGIAIGKSINLAINKNAMLAGNQQTEAEIYLHEVIHTMTKFARMSGTTEARKIDREIEFAMAAMIKETKWEDFLPEVSIDAVLEEANAREMYEYIFNKEHAMDEFMAHVLTNPIVKAKAEKIVIKKDKENKTLLETVVGLFETLMNVVLGNFTFNEKNKTVYEQIYGLAFQLGDINNKAERRKKEKKSMSQSAMDLVNNVDSAVARKLNAFKEKYLTDDSKLEDYPKDGSKWEKGKWLGKFLAKSVVNEEYGKAMGLVASAFHVKPDGILRNVLKDFRDSNDTEKTVEWLLLQSEKIEGDRNAIIGVTKRQVVDGFSKRLNRAEERALLRTVLDTDMAVFLEKNPDKPRNGELTVEEMHRLLTDDKFLNKQIQKSKSRLKMASENSNRGSYNWYSNQAVGLGYYLATGKAHIAQNFNAVNIARGLGSSKWVRPDSLVMREVDVLASLIALQHTGIKEKAIAASLFANESNGVVNLMRLHRGFNENAKQELFDGSTTHMIKGYSKEVFDDSVEMRYAPMSLRTDLEAEGFVFQGELEGKYKDTTAEPMGLFVSRSFGRNEWLRAATRMTGTGSKGTTITESRYADGGEFAKERAARDIKKLDIERIKLVKEMELGEFDITKVEYGLSPIYDDVGNVVNYRYMMSKEVKETLLKQDTSVSEVMARTYGHGIDKLKSKEHNAKMLENILDNMEKNWDGGLLGKDTLTEWTVIKANSRDSKIKDLYQVLPKEFKDAMNRRPDKSLAVPTSMMPLYFGYRHLSIVNFPGLKKIVPKLAIEILRFVEAMWVELIKIAKTNILIKTPIVLWRNIWSNMMQAINTGTNPLKLFKMYLDSFRDARAHIKKHRQLKYLEVKVRSGQAAKADKDLAKRLNSALMRNPMHELMEAGMYQAFQEDVENTELRSTNRVKKYLDEKLENVPNMVRTPLQWLYLSEETGAYKVMQEVLQMSDLIARDVMNRQFKELEQKQADGILDLPIWYLEKNPGIKPRTELKKEQRAAFLDEARARNFYTVLKSFIAYPIPSSSMEEYLNRVGLIMFTKFVKRIQTVAAKTTMEHPVKSTLMALVQSFVYDFETIQDNTLFTKEWYGNHLGGGNIVPLYSIGDHVENLITPAAIKPGTYSPIL